MAPAEIELLARKLYDVYNGQPPNPWKAWDGKPVPSWDQNQNEQVREKWRAVARSVGFAIRSSAVSGGVPEAAQEVSEDRKLTVRGCARCGAEHADLPIHVFAQPFAPREVDVTWPAWATCPTSGDPILIRFTTEG